MYFDEIKKIHSDEEVDDYLWEMVDGQPRYRWYKKSINSVHLIECRDRNHDIDDSSFSDLKIYYESVNWVAHNDPEALAHIMGIITKPVTHIVKEKFLECLEALKYYEACAIVKENLVSIPVPAERTHERKRKKALEDIKMFVAFMGSASNLLFELKTKEPQKLKNKELKNSLGTLLNIDGMYGKEIPLVIDAMEWLRENSPDDLKKQYSKKVCIEIKDQLIGIIAKKEKFKLCTFFNEILITNDLQGYFEIPPYTPDSESKLFNDSDFLSDDEDDN